MTAEDRKPEPGDLLIYDYPFWPFPALVEVVRVLPDGALEVRARDNGERMTVAPERFDMLLYQNSPADQPIANPG